MPCDFRFAVSVGIPYQLDAGPIIRTAIIVPCVGLADDPMLEISAKVAQVSLALANSYKEVRAHRDADADHHDPHLPRVSPLCVMRTKPASRQ